MNKIRKGDNVIVLAGKNKGLTGSVTQLLSKKANPKAGLFVLVKDLNMVKKHMKPNQNKEQPGEVALKEMPLPISNVALIDPKTNQPAKVGIKFLDGKKVRYFKKTGEVIDV